MADLDHSRAKPYDGKRQCQRCRKRQAEFVRGKGKDARYLCRLCREVVEARPPEVMVHDHVKTPAARKAVAFVEARLAPLMPRLLAAPLRSLYLSLRESNMTVGAVVVKSEIQPKPEGGPKGWRPWMQVEVSVRRTHTYPFTKRMVMGSVEVTDPVAQALMGTKWFDEHEDEVFHDAAEVFVYGAGHGLFKPLRHLRLVPGKATLAGRRRFGLEWLKLFREQRTAAVSDVATFGRVAS